MNSSSLLTTEPLAQFSTWSSSYLSDFLKVQQAATTSECRCGLGFVLVSSCYLFEGSPAKLSLDPA